MDKSKGCSLAGVQWLGLVGENTAKEDQGWYLWRLAGDATTGEEMEVQAG